MNYIEFRNKMFDLACFNTTQVYMLFPGFDRNNLWRWTKKGLLIRLRKGLFTFPDYKGRSDWHLYFANKIYRPSYISLHTALSFYGLIPEAVPHIISVTSLKTRSFVNPLGEYFYRSVKENLMFGIELKQTADGRALQIASPEKALLDLLYLMPSYNNRKDMIELRLDNFYIKELLKKERLLEYTDRFKSKILKKRVGQLIKAYKL